MSFSIFLPWKKIQNVFSESFSKFELEKLQKIRSEVLYKDKNLKNRGGKRKIPILRKVSLK
jgi:hypothetical protein